jgi:predicted ATP-dependent protease
VNEKIEGFFDICKERGLTGDQGVLIPETNVKHLMLRQEIRDAVEEGLFSVFPISEIDQGIELLTGIPMGEPDQDGKYPPDTISGKVQARLEKLVKAKDSLDEENSGNDQ